jgi:hypothetical protein
MKGPGKTRIDTFLVNPTAAQENAGIMYDYQSGKTFDHVPINMMVSTVRFEDIMSVAIQPANLNIVSSSCMKQADRKKILKLREKKYEEVWIRYEEQFSMAIEDKDIEKANTIWCLAAETHSWELQDNGERFPLSKPRRGKVLPRCEQKVAGKICDHARIERNWFTQGVDRVLGIAHDL